MLKQKIQLLTKTWILAAILLLLQVSPALANNYSIDGVEPGPFGGATSIEPVTVIGAEETNTDQSKNSALVPPPFGSPSSNTLGTGELLTPNIAGNNQSITATGGTIYVNQNTASTPPEYEMRTRVSYTATTGMFYSDNSLGVLEIPVLNVKARIYAEASSGSLSRGIGHMSQSSIWDGHVALAAHNRGAADYFGDIHNLESGDRIILTTMLGTRTYEVYRVMKIDETDFSFLDHTSINRISLITCVRNQSAYRWLVQAEET